jgi:hypothetical protein
MSFSTTYEDHRAAQHASNAVFEAAASADDYYAAGRLMLAADGAMAGRRAYWSTLEDQATDSTRVSAREAYDTVLAARKGERDAAQAAASLAAEDSDESWHGDDPDADAALEV